MLIFSGLCVHVLFIMAVSHFYFDLGDIKNLVGTRILSSNTNLYCYHDGKYWVANNLSQCGAK